MRCPACQGMGSIYMRDPQLCPWCRGRGKLEPEDFATLPRALATSSWLRLCCEEALELPRQCVCELQTWCPKHGRQCHGSHE
jgi:hypothetical protein